MYTYNPSNYDFLILTNYILHKYNQQLLLPSKSLLRHGDISKHGEFFMHWFCNKSTGLRKLDIPYYYNQIVKRGLRDNKTRFIAMPLVLHNKTTCQENVHGLSHMILVLYDKKYKYLEVFDSATNEHKYDMNILPTVLTNVLVNKLNLQIDGVVGPTSICPLGGLQRKQELEVYTTNKNAVLGGNIGFCSMYALYYLDRRLKYNELKPWDVTAKMLTESKESLTLSIIKYTQNMEQVKRHIEQYTNLTSMSLVVDMVEKLVEYFD